MQGASWKEELPCPARQELRLLLIPYRGFDGVVRDKPENVGRMIVHRDISAMVADIFEELLSEAEFRIEKMNLIDSYANSGTGKLADDDASMADNNTSAFNCRYKTKSTTALSTHSLGMAIDVNPVQNPYVSGANVYPPKGADFDGRPKKDERNPSRTGVISSRVVSIFKSHKTGGRWIWGGDWKKPIDYQHFEWRPDNSQPQ